MQLHTLLKIINKIFNLLRRPRRIININRFINLKELLFFKVWVIMISINKKCLNVGCGHDIRLGWDNWDKSPLNDKVTLFDICSSEDLKKLNNSKYDIIECNHVIGYMNYICTVNFFKAVHSALSPLGTLVLEFPDILKLSKRLLDIEHEKNIDDYIEVMRAYYAFDYKDAFDEAFSGRTYIFGWSAPVVIQALNEAGFVNVKTNAPKTHGKLNWRDTRIEAIKS
jgi:hypothetical protein